MARKETVGTLPPECVVQPMNPTKLKAFLSGSELNKVKIEALLNALRKYNKACKAAADALDKDFNKIIPMAVPVKKSVQPKIKPVTKKPLKKK